VSFDLPSITTKSVITSLMWLFKCSLANEIFYPCCRDVLLDDFHDKILCGEGTAILLHERKVRVYILQPVYPLFGCYFF
jgi:hypothetical protein